MMATITTWAGAALDGAVLVLLAAVLWRLGRDPGAAWAEREARLRAIFDDLRALVAQSEGLARDLDEKLAGRETRLRGLLGEAQEALGGVEPGSARAARAVAPRADAATGAPASTLPPAGAPAAAPGDAEETAERIEALAAAGTAVEEIARRIGVAPAEVRLVIGLQAARAARRRAAAAEARAHA